MLETTTFCPVLINNKVFNSRLLFEHVREKTNNLGSDQVRHKPACTVTQDG